MPESRKRLRKLYQIDNSSAHSVRCSDRDWEAARKRAEDEGWKLNGVLSELIAGYAEGKITPPKMARVYEDTTA